MKIVPVIALITGLWLFNLPGERHVYGQDPVFSQFFAAPVYLNPAFAGSTKCSRIALNYRQLRSIENFHTINFTYDNYVDALQGGIGFMVTSDIPNMYLSRNSLSGFYAYHLRVSRDVDIHFGVQAGYVRNDSRWDNFEFHENESQPDDNTWTHDFDVSSGIMLFSDLFYGGVAVHHMIEPSMSLYDNEQSKLNRKYTGHLGVYLEPGSSGGLQSRQRDFFLSPNITYQHQGHHAYLGYGVYTGIKPLMGGVWFRQWIDYPVERNNTLVFFAGINVDDYRIGYSYDYSLSGFSDVMHAAHEISIVFRFNCAGRNIGSSAINYPRF